MESWIRRASCYFARDPKYSWFHEPSKNRIHFLNIPLRWKTESSALALASPYSLVATHVNVWLSFRFLTASILSTEPCGILNTSYLRDPLVINCLPFFSQWNEGWGYPDALQVKLALRPLATLMLFGAYVIFGAPEKYINKRLNCSIKMEGTGHW